jgi:hypothetical protein
LTSAALVGRGWKRGRQTSVTSRPVIDCWRGKAWMLPGGREAESERRFRRRLERARSAVASIWLVRGGGDGRRSEERRRRRRGRRRIGWGREKEEVGRRPAVDRMAELGPAQRAN